MTMTSSCVLKTFDYAVAIGNLESYIHFVNLVPMLSEEQEQSLARAWHEEASQEAAKQLVLAHLRFVVKIAKTYSGYGLALADLVQEGNIGLMKAVKRFDPNVGVRLVSFAVHWIKAEMHEFIIKNWRIVKIATTKAQRKLFFNLRSAKKRLGWFTREEVDAVASDLGVSREEVLKMEARLNASSSDVSFDIDENEEEGLHGSSRSFAPCEYLTDNSMDPARLFELNNTEVGGREQLYEAFTQLDVRSQDILSARWLCEKKATLHELAAKYRVSAERIRQLENQAMLALKKHILVS
jgi:RNA polymerase sigma-32 factor